MKTIFDRNAREELITRIEQINGNKQAQWGKMNAYQMLQHNTYWNEWILGKNDYIYKQTFMGKLFGKIALKRMIRDEQPFDKNIPTSEQFKPKLINGNLGLEIAKWITLTREYESYCNPNFVHDFFGRMTKEEI